MSTPEAPSKLHQAITRRGFLREIAITTGAVTTTLVGINRLPDSEESLQRTFAAINEQCTNILPQAVALAVEQGNTVTPEDEQQGIEWCNRELQSRIYDEDQIFDPERLRRLGNTLTLAVGGIGTAIQTARFGVKITRIITNSRLTSILKGSSS